VSAVCCVLLCCLAASAPADAAFSVPPQGAYDQCPPTPDLARCAENLNRISQAGMTVMLNYTSWYATPQDLLAYADAAQAAGVKLIWPLNDKPWRGEGSLLARYPKLARVCGCADLLAYVISLLKDHPATYGWYVGDEQPGDYAPAIGHLAAAVKQLDATHPTIFVQLGLRDRPGGNLTPFASLVDLPGVDIYPVGTNWPVGQLVGDVMRDAAAQTQAAGKPLLAVLQSFSWQAYPDEVSGVPDPRFPTRQEMIDMRDAAITVAQPSLILWYSLNDLDELDPDGSHFADLAAAVAAPSPAFPSPPPAAQPPTHAAPVKKHQRSTRARCARLHQPKRRRACRAKARHDRRPSRRAAAKPRQRLAGRPPAMIGSGHYGYQGHD